MGIATVWNYLKKSGMTDAGTAGVIGNLQAESGVSPTAVDMLCLKGYRKAGKIYTDKSYTAAVDSGEISKAEFLKPMGKQYGYGIAQWTYPSRKEGLFDLCKNKGTSIGDERTQADFLIYELKTSFKGLWKTLTEIEDVDQAADSFLTEFERPADVGFEKQKRRNLARNIYRTMTGGKVVRTREAVVKQATAWLGRKESDGSHKLIIDTYNSHKPLPRGYKVQYTDAWCATFVSAVAIKCGYTDIIPIECSCPEMVTAAKKMGIWTESDAYVPKPGDIILYDWHDSGIGDNTGVPDHVGIVVESGSASFKVIEGNKSDAVRYRIMPINGRYIRGFICPKYDTGTKTEARTQGKKTAYAVQAGYFNSRTNAEAMAAELKKKGFEAFVYEVKS